jgi:hypothetical protein
MMIGRFERFKCSFGVEGEQLPALKLPLPAPLAEMDFPEHGIHNGHLFVSRYVGPELALRRGLLSG